MRSATSPGGDTIPHRAEGEGVLLDHVPLDVNRILDLGTGDGRLLALLRRDRPGSAGVGLDSSETMLEAARARFADDPGIELIRHDFAFPLPDLGNFDAVGRSQLLGEKRLQEPPRAESGAGTRLCRGAARHRPQAGRRAGAVRVGRLRGGADLQQQPDVVARRPPTGPLGPRPRTLMSFWVYINQNNIRVRREGLGGDGGMQVVACSPGTATADVSRPRSWLPGCH